MAEQIKIEPHYQAQAKELVDCLFDKGYFSDVLNRNGMEDVEELLAYYLQAVVETSARCEALTKKYKATTKGRQEGEDQPRHEEEMRWIARAREAETRLAKLETESQPFKWPPSWVKAPGWARDVGALLKNALEPPWGLSGRENFLEASRLFTKAIELGIIPEPDCRPSWEVRPDDDGCACPPEAVCPRCGGRKLDSGEQG